MADNGSTDGSIAIAESLGARVVHVSTRGYGNALRRGIEEAKGDARTNFEIAQRLAGFGAGSSAGPSHLSFVECEEAAKWEDLAQPRRAYDIIVDALFGTGLTRPLEGIHRQVVEHIGLLRRARERNRGRRAAINAAAISRYQYLSAAPLE